MTETDFDREIAKLVDPAFSKVVPIGAEPVGFEPLSDILKRVDDQEIREDVFLNTVGVVHQTLQSRLRHRATMMRRRADEFDGYADAIDVKNKTLNGVVESVMEHIKNLEYLLDEHAHIEPEVVR